ncbi:MAG: tetratricopeptide repeat protein [Nitrospinota bacterium]
MATKPTPRIDRRKLKQPDEFITLTSRAIKYVQIHRARVVAAVVGVLLIVVLVVAYRQYRTRQEDKAAVLVSQATEAFAKDPTQSAPFERVLRAYPGTQGARLARLYLGHVFYRRGEADKAAKVYGALVEDSATQEPILSRAILGQGYALIALKRCEEAETAFGRLSSAQPLSQQEAFLAVGRCFELRGDRQAAFERYRQFAQKFPASPFLTEAFRSRIGVLRK